MKLCIDARMYHASGIGTYLQNLLPSLIDHFDLILIGDPEEIAAKKYNFIPTQIPVYSVAELLRFPFLVPKCDIFWSPHYNVPLLPVPAKKRLVTIHDVFHLAFFHTLSLKQKLYAKMILRAAARRSDHILTVSEFSKSEIIRYLKVKPDKVTVIPNGVNHQQFKTITDPGRRKAVQTRYQLPEKFILYVGNVKPHKNLLSLVRALAHLEEQHLVVVGKKEGFITGDAELFEFLNQDEKLARRITFTGYVEAEDLPVLYSLADLFVFPSRYEGFGLPPLEAMACGCPVLVSNRASMPEICGDDIPFINPDNPEEIAGKITAVLSASASQHRTLIKTGLQRAALFTWEKSIRSHIARLEELSTY